MLKKDIINITKQIEEKLSESFQQKYVSLLFPVPRLTSKSLIEHCRENNLDFFYWKKPSEQFTFLGIDKLLDYSQESDNSEIVSKKIKFIQNNIFTNWNDYSLENIPLFVGGLKFNNQEEETRWDDYKFQNWLIPRYTFIRTEENYFLQINFEKDNYSIQKIIEDITFLLASVSDKKVSDSIERNGFNKIPKNDFVEWESQIADSLSLIRNKELNKIVISRFEEKELKEKINIYSMLSELSSSFPFCTIFGFQSGKSFFFGATPETLFKIANNQLETDALAGSISRGKNIYEDDHFANQLLTSDKNIREHNEVKDFILSVLQNHAKMIIASDTPKIRKLKNIQHLWTPIKATINKDVNVLSILSDIHPTPAVCGSPKKIAYENIPKIENFKRGMFTGVIGWFNHLQVADFSVAIRSALIKEKKLFAYAGCGIVEGSNAKEEYEETKLKLNTILSLFIDEED